jgi:glycosyltransferase involved in cell wall biosynthesis
LFLGRLSYTKGLHLLVRAFASVREARPRAHLVIAGPDDEGLASSLAAYARRLGIGRAVTMPGMLVGDEKRDVLAAADVWVMPSRTENFGLALLEALAAGVPAAVSDAVALGNEASRFGAVQTFRLGIEEMSAALIEVLADETRRCALRERGRIFSQRYDWRAVAPVYADMYTSVLAAAPRTSATHIATSISRAGV